MVNIVEFYLHNLHNIDIIGMITTFNQKVKICWYICIM